MAKVEQKIVPLNGDNAVAYAAKQCDVDVVAAYPITPATEIDFVEENGRVYIVKKKGQQAATRKFAKLRGAATVRMTTDEIMALTRADP